jgi:serine protease Do
MPTQRDHAQYHKWRQVMKKKNLILSLFLIFIGLVIGLALTSNLGVQKLSLSNESKVPSIASEFLGKLSKSLADVATAATPSVVNVSTTSTVTMSQSPYGDLFNDPFFRRFFEDQFRHPDLQRKYKTSALGSGVIVTDDGYILTNNHVVQNADEIKVVLYDKREFTGKVIGTDPKTDLAVIKIDAAGLPALTIGDSEALKVGDIVIAIGNPFALSETITMGIVSAIGRSNIGLADYEDFIQTDAAINPGNSGGAMVNTQGELVGINTAIFSTSGGYMGIGFAIPSNMARGVMESIIKHGKVIRGWLGVTIQNITPELAQHFGIKETTGTLVSDVMKNSPAEKAGLKRGDLIVEFGGKKIDDATSLKNAAAQTPPGTAVKVKILRDGKEKTLTVTLGEFPEQVAAAMKHEYSNVLRGVNVQDLTPDVRSSMNIPDNVQGVIISNVEASGPASAVLQRGDVIQEINRHAIRNRQDYQTAVSKVKPDDSVLLLVYRRGGSIYVTLTP